MKGLKLLATALSFAIAGLGFLGIAAPSILLEFARSLVDPPALYWVAAVRVIFGALLILVAAESLLPKTLRVIGSFIVVAGLLTPVFGSSRFGEALAWLSGHGPLFVRGVAAVALFAGLFFMYAINARRRDDRA